MTGIDTNVLIRLLVEDDPEQVERVSRFLRKARTSDEPAFVGVVVLCEAAWVLAQSYGFSKTAILDAFLQLLDVGMIQVEDEDTVREAIDLARKTPGDFAGHLIGCRNKKAGCRTSVTFDRRLSRAANFTTL